MKRLLIIVLLCLVFGCSRDTQPARLLGEVDCMQKACAVSNQTLEVRLTLPDDIKPLTPFVARVDIVGMDDIETVRAKFEMPGMDMGQNQYDLVQDEQGAWQAESILPVCVTGRSDWQAVVEMTSGGIVYKALFNFVISH